MKRKISDIGLSNTVIAMLRSTAQDIRYGSSDDRMSALEFLQSDWFTDICDAFDFDCDRIKYMILTKRVSWRKNYE